MIHTDATTDNPPDQMSSDPGAVRRTLALRDFRLLLGGSTTSLLGDQFALIATPWLVLQLTDDPFALGLVLALEGIPRALFMLIGGAVTDRVSPRRMMIITDIVRGLLAAALAAIVLSGSVQMWMLYAFALGFGMVAGLAVPAQNSIVPTLVPEGDLQAGNAVIMGVTQLSAFVGPTLAGVLIGASTSSTSGVGLAFGLDAVTFAISGVTIALMRPQRLVSPPEHLSGLFASIGEGCRHLWADEAMRFVFCVLAAVNLFVVGPLMIGIPLLAHQRLAEGATAFGVLMGAFAIGNLGGYLLAAVTRAPSSTAMRAIIVGVLAGYGVVVASLGLVTHLWLGAVLMVGLGTGNGYLAITLFTWIQVRTPQWMLGRMMSLLTFASLGLVSVSQAASGALSTWNLDALFALSGGLVLATTVRVATHRSLRTFTDGLADAARRHTPMTTPTPTPTRAELAPPPRAHHDMETS